VETVDIVIAIGLGLGLAAACGFRVFVPPLVLGLAGLGGYVDVSADFQWLATWPAVTALGAATVLEIGAYYIPWVDNALDMVAGPAAVIAGIVVSAAVIGDLSPGLKWPLAVIAGGGGAGLAHAGTTAVRAVSTVTTGGLGNPIVSTVESFAAALTSILAVVMPALALLALAVFAVVVWRWLRRRRSMATPADPADRADPAATA